MRYFRPTTLSLTVQRMHLQQRFSGRGDIRHSRLIWVQDFRPHVLAHIYRCRVEYTIGAYPRVFCLAPKLSELAAGRKLPHVRSRTEPVELCLFMHQRECWRDAMLLADVVVPLTSYWLAHFEEWLFSGHWRGGGTHEITIAPPLTPPVFPDEPPVSAAGTTVDVSRSLTAAA